MFNTGYGFLRHEVCLFSYSYVCSPKRMSIPVVSLAFWGDVFPFQKMGLAPVDSFKGMGIALPSQPKIPSWELGEYQLSAGHTHCQSH